MTHPDEGYNHARPLDEVCMDRLLVRTLLIVAAVLAAALVMGLFSGPARGIALCSSGLFCLFACRLRLLSEEHMHAAHVPVDPLLARADLQDCAQERLLPEPLLTRTRDPNSAYPMREVTATNGPFSLRHP